MKMLESVTKLASQYDVVVVGAGHAGCEAAIAAAKIGAKTLLVTGDLTKVAALPCNPSVGGPGKGHLVREIDALGGVMARVVDKSAIQVKELNTSKGPAVRAYRAQLDRAAYNQNMIAELANTSGLECLEDSVVGVEVKNEGKRIKDKVKGSSHLRSNDKRITGVETDKHGIVKTKNTIICSGTFMNGEIIVGSSVVKKGGRIDEKAQDGLSESLQALGLESGRLKTGTPPRIKRNSINYKDLEEAPGTAGKISFAHPARELMDYDVQELCWLTYTNEKTHQMILKNYHLSGNISGLISETGPRSCPSLDLKVKNFPDKSRHPIFIEPVGAKGSADGDRMYLQGCSTAFSPSLQEKIFRSIKGLENIEFLEYGYAVRYDYFLPHQLKTTLESKKVNGLYFAGQMNGTTGYEEAAAQGLIAGINAARKTDVKSEFVLRRDEAYIGVLIEDLVTKTHVEPYRMFTSRAEYRLLLRNDNADTRLTKKGYVVGLQSRDVLKRVEEKQRHIEREVEKLENCKVRNGNETVSAAQILRKPDYNIEKLESEFGVKIDNKVSYNVEIIVKYGGYFKRQIRDAQRMREKAHFILSSDIDYQKITGLRNEAKLRLAQIRPETLAQAALVQGITPADLNLVLIHLHAQSRKKKSKISVK